jgi:hypothetical protein
MQEPSFGIVRVEGFGGVASLAPNAVSGAGALRTRLRACAEEGRLGQMFTQQPSLACRLLLGTNGI